MCAHTSHPTNSTIRVFERDHHWSRERPCPGCEVWDGGAVPQHLAQSSEFLYPFESTFMLEQDHRDCVCVCVCTDVFNSLVFKSRVVQCRFVPASHWVYAN